MVRPSDFIDTFPYLSVLGKYEAEEAALNIMKVLARTGDCWRALTWEEYAKETGSTYDKYFMMALEYCANELNAASFASSWRRIVNDHMA